MAAGTTILETFQWPDDPTKFYISQSGTCPAHHSGTCTTVHQVVVATSSPYGLSFTDLGWSRTTGASYDGNVLSLAAYRPQGASAELIVGFSDDSGNVFGVRRYTNGSWVSLPPPTRAPQRLVGVEGYVFSKHNLCVEVFDIAAGTWSELECFTSSTGGIDALNQCTVFVTEGGNLRRR